MSAEDDSDSKEIKEKAADAANDVGVLMAQAVEAMRKVVDDFTRLANADNSDKVAALKEAGRAASDNIGAFAHDARELSEARLDDLSAAVRRNPLTWLAVAAGVGLIVGLWKNRDTTR